MTGEKKLLKVLDLTIKLSKVKRKVRYERRHFENDAEHSYQLALASWMVNEQYSLHLENEKLLKLALVHDLLEVYTGDFDGHRTEELQHVKKLEEEKAIKTLKIEYSELKAVIKEIEEYEKKESLESKLINMLDKAIPIRLVYKLNDSYYKRKKITVDDYVAWFYNKSRYHLLPKQLQAVADDLIEEVKTAYSTVFYMRNE